MTWTDYKIAREKMVQEQLVDRGIADKRVIAAMLQIPRHLFLDGDAGPQAYSDHAFPIGYSQTMSQPYTVAYLAQCLELEGHERILEVGTGSGYQAAVLSKIAAEIYSIERIAPLAERAAATLKKLNIRNVHIKVGDGTCGWTTSANFDRVLFTAATKSVSHHLIMQIRDSGFFLGPVEMADGEQEIVKITREGNTCSLKRLKQCAFVPIIRGSEGTNEDSSRDRERPRSG